MANPKHWSNEAGTIKLIKEIMIPYATKTKATLGLGSDQKTLPVWDAFRGHLTSAVKLLLEESDIVAADIPANHSHLSFRLDSKAIKH